MTKLDKALATVVSTLGGEQRDGQVQMLNAVDESLRKKHHLLVQAGTGTGKSVAYLLPSIVYAMERNTCVIISTATLMSLRRVAASCTESRSLRSSRLGSLVNAS